MVKKCVICGNIIKKGQGWDNDRICSSKCFTIDFWNEKMKIKENPRTARIEGSHYIIGNEDDLQDSFRGFGGGLFLIQFNDGRLVKSTNLWHQGEIPLHLTGILVNNAEFVKCGKCENCCEEEGRLRCQLMSNYTCSSDFLPPKCPLVKNATVYNKGD